jgi:AcrR family transcriptional regulator
MGLCQDRDTMDISPPFQKDPSPFPDRHARLAARTRKREAVLLTAVRMFNAQGFHATSLDDVAARLGVSKPTIYHYFPSKDQVLLACVRVGVDQLLEAARIAGCSEGSGLDRLREFLWRYAVITMDDFGRCVVRTGEELLSGPSRLEFRAIKREVDNSLRALIEAAVADGSAQVKDVRMAGFAIAGALNWPARWHRADGALQPEALGRQLADFLIDGLRR